MNFRIGTGYDLHLLTEGRPLMLGGVEIPSGKGEAGHSDGDVLIHAIVDALLGSVAAGDIGTHFPDTDPKWKDTSSSVFLKETIELLSNRGFTPVNIDCTVILEHPRLKPHIPAIRNNLAGIMGINPKRISVKATTQEGTGAIGHGKAIACQAIVLVQKVQQHESES